jgi:hypothetical protein
LKPPVLADFLDCRYDIINRFIAHTWINGKRNAPPIFRFRDGEVPFSIAEGALIVRLKMKRDKVNARPDPASSQFFNEVIAIDIEVI